MTDSTRKDAKMLVLSRYVGEKIMIGDDVVVTVVSVRGDKIRIGIEAPLGVRVDREEVRERRERERRGCNDGE